MSLDGLAPIRALIIIPHYAGLLVDGIKTWEMRKKPTTIRGTVAIAAKGTKTIVGVADLVGCGERLDIDKLAETEAYHRIRAEDHAAAVKGDWTVPWIFARARRFKSPLAYAPTHGAVIWVNLEDGTRAGIVEALKAD
jgi:hypothetical protein